MDGEVALAFHSTALSAVNFQPSFHHREHHHPHHNEMGARSPVGGCCPNRSKLRAENNAYMHGLNNHQNNQILHSILSMEASRAELGCHSPPGHGYVIPPPGQLPISDPELQYSWSTQYPTPPSSHSSSPGPPQMPPSPQETPSPAFMDHGSFSDHDRSMSPPRSMSWSSNFALGARADDPDDVHQPMDLKKRLRSPSPKAGPSHDQPMDLSCPKRLKISHYNEGLRSESAACNCARADNASPSAAASAAPTGSNVSGAIGHTSPFKRPSRKSVYEPADAPSNESLLKSILCGHLRSRSPSLDSQDNRRSGSPFVNSLSSSHGLTRSPQQRVSYLLEKARKLQQQQQKQQQQRQKDRSEVLPGSPAAEASAVSSVPSPLRLSGDTEVSLAKKNLHPVSARVSEWLYKAVEFAKSLTDFQELDADTQVTLLQGAWSRLLMLHMAETNFEFAVNPCASSSPSHAAHSPPPTLLREDDSAAATLRNEQCSGAASTRMRPTMEAVDRITSFLRKCQTLDISTEEMTLLKLLTLFNPSYQNLAKPALVEGANTHIRRRLQEACAALPDQGRLRYSQLLLVLPSLFGIRPEVVESLFCQHITTNTNMVVFLKDALNKSK